MPPWVITVNRALTQENDQNMDTASHSRSSGDRCMRSPIDHILSISPRCSSGTPFGIEVDPEADYQSAATALAAVDRSGIENYGLAD